MIDNETNHYLSPPSYLAISLVPIVNMYEERFSLTLRQVKIALNPNNSCAMQLARVKYRTDQDKNCPSRSVNILPPRIIFYSAINRLSCLRVYIRRLFLGQKCISKRCTSNESSKKNHSHSFPTSSSLSCTLFDSSL